MNQFQSLGEVLAAFRRRFLLMLVIVALGCVLSLKFALSQDKLYEAAAVVQIEESRIPDSLAGPAAQTTGSAQRVRLIEQRLMARDNLVRIMEEHDLFNKDPSLGINERVYQMRQAASVQEIVNGAQSWQPGVTPTGLIIKVRLDDAQKAADLANELMYSVVEQSRQRGANRARDTNDFFALEARRIEGDITAMESRLATFKEANSDSLPAGIAMLRDQMRTLQEADLNLDQEIITIQSNAARQREEVLDRQIALLQEQKALIAQRLSEMDATIAAGPEVERELSTMERELTRLRDQYSVITRRQAEAEMGQLLEDRQQSDRFEVLETALVPEFPVSRSRKKTALMGAVASVLVAIAAGFVAELLNPAIRTAAQMERMLGIQPVVSIPYVQSRRERGRLRALWLTGILALLAGLYAAVKYGASLVPHLGMFDRFLPRSTQL
ncbi:chain-length determining protein [Puniceibacterium confluentis]|uniref:chain-length determining protein n=1 Tax=Puniceibacterium confluentis TaxID=1958944 RepID=UPI0011B6ACCF|nr:chain-length determining protein [Puniceibacterium confluentis]